MRAMTRCILTFLLVAAAMAASQARAADPLEALPADVDYVVRYASVDQFVGNAGDMLAAIGPAAQKAAKQLESDLARELVRSGHGLDALDRKAPVYSVHLLLPKSKPGDATRVVVAKTKDLDELYQALMGVEDLKQVERTKHGRGFLELKHDERRCYVARRGEYVLYTFDRQAFETLVQFDFSNQPTLAATIPPAARKELESGDAALWVNVPLLAKRYDEQIKSARKQVVEFIKRLSDEDLGVPNAKKAKELYTQIAGALFDSVADTTWAVASVSLGASGGAATVSLGYKKDSTADEFLVANPPLPLANLELLPAKAPVYVGFRMSYSGLGETLLLTNYGNNPADRKAAEAALKLLREADVQSSVASMTIPTEGKHGMVTTTLEQAKDADKLRRGWSGYLKALSGVETPVVAQKFEYKEKAEQHNGHAIDLFKTEFKITTDDAEAEAILNSFFARLFGGMSFQARLAAVENLLVQTTGNDPKFIRQVLDSFDSGEGVLGLEKAYAGVRDRLSKKANVLMLVNAPQLVIDSVNLIKQVEPFGTLLGFTPYNFNLQPPVSYTGVSLTTGPQSLRVHVFVPVEQPRGILQIFMPGI